MIFNILAASALELAINKTLALSLKQFPDENGIKSLLDLDGKVVAIDLTGLHASFFLLFNHDTVHVQSNCAGHIDTRISGTPLSLLRIKFSGRQQQMLFSGDITITGDIETGKQVSKLMHSLNIDWEEHLSHLTGDVIAHELSRQSRTFSHWAQQSMATLAQNTREYLQEEAQLLPPKHILEPFLTAVDTLRNNTARLEKRVARLQTSLKSRNA